LYSLASNFIAKAWALKMPCSASQMQAYDERG